MKVMMNVRMVMMPNITQVRITSNARVSNPIHRKITKILLDSTGTMDMRRTGMSGLRKLSAGKITTIT